MNVTELEAAIVTLDGHPEDIRKKRGKAIDRVIALLDRGELRVCEPGDGGWVTHPWIKRAILLYFQRLDSVAINPGKGRTDGPSYFDKIPTKRNFEESGARCVPGGVARFGAFLGRGTILMPGFVNIGAYVDAGSMVDTWATVGSCAQIGKNCHISGGVGIGGVLEPLQAGPVIVEDNCFIGARSEVAEGVIVREGAVLSMGVFIGASTKIVDRDSGAVCQGEVPSYAVVVPGSLPGRPRGDGEPVPSLSCAVIVKRVDEKTRAKTSINELLRD
jgi:2,3,4,5-tetrahydropyridine-2-carboxylate N-succinyltransferase